MDTITIVRTYKDDHTHGELYINDNYQCSTLELPYTNNEKYISCIPEGTYNAQFHYSKKHKACLLILKVKNRSEILIHVGNTIQDTQGCILVGQKYTTRELRNSRKSMHAILEKLMYSKIVVKITSNENNIY